MFLERLQRSCEARYPGETACAAWARAYHAWIVRTGAPAYRRAQAAARSRFALPDGPRAPERCGTEEPIVDLTRRVRRAVDQTVTVEQQTGGSRVRYWAYDFTTERLRVWERPDGSYCELWEDVGSFVTVPGPSPAGQDAMIRAGIRGSVRGTERTSYRARVEPDATTHGNLATVDYACRIHGPENTSRTCGGNALRLRATVFRDVRGERFEWSGWLYHSRGRGSWLQFARVSIGDIYD